MAVDPLAVATSGYEPFSVFGLASDGYYSGPAVQSPVEPQTAGAAIGGGRRWPSRGEPLESPTERPTDYARIARDVLAALKSWDADITQVSNELAAQLGLVDDTDEARLAAVLGVLFSETD